MKKINITHFLFLITLMSTTNIINSKDLFEDYYPQAEEILKKMTTAEKIGQLFLGAYTLSEADKLIEKCYLGGFVVFEKSVLNHTKEELINEFQERQKISKIPLVFSVDEEGGTVQRIGSHFRDEPFPSPRESYLKNGIKEILNIEKEKRKLLKELQFNVNLAPVADISLNESDYIYKRTLGENVNITTDYITNVVSSYVKDKFTCCLKHFPGYGNNTNTHDDVAHDYRPLEQFENNDLVPFIKSINKKVPMIMFSHNIVHCIDEEYPASLSKKLHELLKNKYEYSGLILTDSLSMDAITKYIKNISAAVLAVEAGNDLLVTSDFENHYNELLAAVNRKDVDMKLIDNAAKRVLAWKLMYLYESNENENEDEGISVLNIILFCVLGVCTIGLIVLFVMVFIQYCKDDDEDKEKEKKIDYLMRDTTASEENK